MRIEHPRAAKGQTPPDRVGYAPRSHADVDDEGYFEVPEKYAPQVMDSLAQRHDVEYDDGDVVLPDATPAEEDGPPDAEDEPVASEDADEDVGSDEQEFDLESFLDRKYTDRADAVRAGEVDAHLDEIEAAETSETVADAIEARRDELAEGE